MIAIRSRSRGTRLVRATRRGGGGIADEARSATGQVRNAVEGALEQLPGLMETARTGAEHLPDAFERVRLGAKETTATLQTLPDQTLQLLAAASIGMAAGLYLAGAPRLVTFAAIAPALIVGLAIVTRPGRVR